MQDKKALNMGELIDNINFFPLGNGEKITQDVSILLQFTKDCCFNCCSGDRMSAPDYYGFVTCNNPSSGYRGLDNSASGIVCDKHEI